MCASLLSDSLVLRAGDLLLMDRGLLDGATIADLKRRRQVDVIVPSRYDMLSYQEAGKLAERANRWDQHLTRSGRQIAFVPSVEHVWDECDVTLNACVIRFYNNHKQAFDYIVLVTTDLSLSARWIVKHRAGLRTTQQRRLAVEEAEFDALQPDCLLPADGGAQLQPLSSFANTQAGARFADKTRQAIAADENAPHPGDCLRRRLL